MTDTVQIAVGALEGECAYSGPVAQTLSGQGNGAGADHIAVDDLHIVHTVILSGVVDQTGHKVNSGAVLVAGSGSGSVGCADVPEVERGTGDRILHLDGAGHAIEDAIDGVHTSGGIDGNKSVAVGVIAHIEQAGSGGADGSAIDEHIVGAAVVVHVHIVHGGVGVAVDVVEAVDSGERAGGGILDQIAGCLLYTST